IAAVSTILKPSQPEALWHTGRAAPGTRRRSPTTNSSLLSRRGGSAPITPTHFTHGVSWHTGAQSSVMPAVRPPNTPREYAALLPDQVRVLGPLHPETLVTRSNVTNSRGQSGDIPGAISDYT